MSKNEKTDAWKLVDIGYKAANERRHATYEEIVKPLINTILSRFETENLPVTDGGGMSPEYVLAMQIALDHIGILMLEARIKGDFEARRLSKGMDS